MRIFTNANYDFIRWRWDEHRWPIFNVADICIDVAAVMILVQAVRGVRLDGTRVARHHDQPGTPQT